MSFLKGKEKTYKADALAPDVNTAGKTGLSMLLGSADTLNRNVYDNSESFVDNQISTENRLLRNASDDAMRRTRQLVAQRGMGSSSIGLGQEINQERQFADRMALNKASALDRLKDLQIERMNTGSQLFNTKLKGNAGLQMQDIKKRSGGAAGIIGAGVGAVGGFYASGMNPAGAAAGAKAGMELGNAYAAS